MRWLSVVPGAAGLAAILAGQEWPQHLGPTRNGVYTGPWSEKSSFARTWTRPVGEGFSAPAVSAGRLIVFHREGAQEIVESLDAATGKSQWRFAYPAGYKDDFGFSDGPRATPTVEGGRVYTYGAGGMLHSLDLTTGRKVWSRDGPKEFGVRKEFFGAACSPVIDGVRLLMNIGGAGGAGIVALDKATGATLWKALAHEAGYASPTVASIGGERHALFFTREGLVDADPATGRIRFQHRWRARQAASVNAAIPLAVGNEVFLSASYDTGAVLLRIEGDKAAPVWSGDESLSNHYSTSVYKDGTLYGFHGRQEFGQELRAVDWKTGRVLWSAAIGAGTVTLAGTHLFAVKENGELVVAPASPKGFQPARTVRVADGTIRAYPAFAAGRMYIRTSNTLSCWRID